MQISFICDLALHLAHVEQNLLVLPTVVLDTARLHNVALSIVVKHVRNATSKMVPILVYLMTSRAQHEPRY